MKYEHLLKQHHLKATPQRIAIMRLMQERGHISIEDLYAAIRQKFASISLATLYKNIHTMMGVQLVREVKMPGQKAKYEIEKAPHAHILCTECGEFKDIEVDSEQLLKKAVDESGYKANEVAIVISGTCPECRSK